MSGPVKSIYRKDIGAGVVKNYSNGVVGFQPNRMSHDEYKSGMKPLKNISPTNNDLLNNLTKK